MSIELSTQTAGSGVKGFSPEEGDPGGTTQYKYPGWELTHSISAHTAVVRTSHMSPARSEEVWRVLSTTVLLTKSLSLK